MIRGYGQSPEKYLLLLKLKYHCPLKPIKFTRELLTTPEPFSRGLPHLHVKRHRFAILLTNAKLYFETPEAAVSFQNW
jgi:hypothetical protein